MDVTLESGVLTVTSQIVSPAVSARPGVCGLVPAVTPTLLIPFTCIGFRAEWCHLFSNK